MGRSDLERLSREELIELVLRLQRPEKTSRTSSKPPATDRKERREQAKPGGAKPGYEGHSRVMSEDPDAVVDHRPGSLRVLRRRPARGSSRRDRERVRADRAAGGDASRHSASSAGGELPDVRDAGRRAGAGGGARDALRPTAPCGGDVSEDLPGAVLRAAAGGTLRPVRSHAQPGRADEPAPSGARRFRPGREEAVSTLRRATVVASDETGVRIEGSNAYHWVFHSAEAVVHQASPTRGAVVVREMMDGHRPAVWISDRYTAQQGHAAAHQTCLAHLARDVAYVVEASDDPVPWRLQLWLRSVFALAERVTDLATSTLAAKRRSLDRQLGAILATPSRCDLTRDLQAKIGRARHQLLVFLAHPGAVEPTNNGSERLLRPSVVQRKVTNGYRATWAAEGEAAIRTVVDTARLTRRHPFGTILKPSALEAGRQRVGNYLQR